MQVQVVAWRHVSAGTDACCSAHGMAKRSVFCACACCEAQACRVVAVSRRCCWRRYSRRIAAARAAHAQEGGAHSLQMFTAEMLQVLRQSVVVAC